MRKAILFSFLVLAVMASTALAQGRGNGRGRGHHHDVYSDRVWYGNSNDLPPGLAKRNGNLPPGLQKHLDRTGHLPPGLEKRYRNDYFNWGNSNIYARDRYFRDRDWAKERRRHAREARKEWREELKEQRRWDRRRR